MYTDAMGRRAAVFAAAIVVCGKPAKGQVSTANSHSFQFRIDEEVAATIPPEQRRRLRIVEDTSPDASAQKEQVPPSRGVPLVAIAVGIMAIPIAWQTIQEMVRQHYYGGVVIDMRQTPTLVTNSRAVPADLIIVINPNGAREQFRSHEFVRSTLQGVLEKLK